jgi:peroxiredoxin
LSGRYDEVTSKGAAVGAIGMGIPEMAADFRDRQEIPFPLLVDRTKETYRALQMKKGNLWDVVGPSNWTRYAKAMITGHGVDMPKQDPYQMGGVLVVRPDGKILYEFRASESRDTPPLEEVIAALP